MIFDFLRRSPAPRIATSFGRLSPKPFGRGDTEAYCASYEPGAYLLELKRPRYFAWELLSGERSFSDFSLAGEVQEAPPGGSGACGFLLRCMDEQDFYAFLVSGSGMFRFDLVRNNHPVALVEWTRLAAAEAAGHAAGPRRLRLVAHGSRFTFAVDDEWVGEIEDETLPAGRVGFAAQTYDGTGSFRLRSFELDARPLAVEREHYGWSYFFPALPAARLRLAETLFAQGAHGPAAVQVRKALKGREGTVREHFLLAECYVRLSLYDEALAEIGEVLRREPGHAEARTEKANVLYLADRLLEARDEAAAALAGGPPAPLLLNLLGNAEYGLGNWSKAAEAYLRAVDEQPGVAPFLRNAARALERAGRGAEALDYYLRAARIFFREEAYGELSLVLPRLRALDPPNSEARGLEAKMLYHEGRIDDALERLSALAAEGCEDSAVHYLLGLVLSDRGRREDALPRFEEAARREPSFALYHFRAAETLRALGRDPAPALARALALAPEDPWINNLAGLLDMEAGDLAAAVGRFRAALAAAPDEPDILVNCAEALSLSGSHEEGLALLAAEAAGDRGGPARARLANQRGNILARQKRFEEAVREYEAALRLDPASHAFKENCAAACIEIDMIHRAEELLAQVEPEHPSATVYNMIGTVAALKGERARAEAAYRAGLAREPTNPDIAVNLALLSLEKSDWQAAARAAEAVLGRTPGHARALALRERIRARYQTRLECASCGREWWAPRELPPQPGLMVRGEPPADAPAGRCPSCGLVYCVGCASGHVRESRFYCPSCGQFLKLSDHALRWLLVQRIEAGQQEDRPPRREGAST
jgi:tetratricopeptide (TPR) repeat protein